MSAIGCGLILCVLLLFVACTGPKQIAISEITSDSTKYEGQKVAISGEYRGWETGHGSPPVTRSDWIIKDNSGSMYVTGRVALDPTKNVGKNITVYGTIRVKEGKAYMEAEAVK